jgi:hypothetical protein
VKSCLDRIRELYADYTPEEIAQAIGQYRKDVQEREDLERLMKQRDDLDTKILKFGKTVAE